MLKYLVAEISSKGRLKNIFGKTSYYVGLRRSN